MYTRFNVLHLLGAANLAAALLKRLLTPNKPMRVIAIVTLSAFVSAGSAHAARQSPQTPPATPGAPQQRLPGPAVTPPEDYVIGAEDALGIIFWRDESMTSDVVVRPDGKITLPLLNEVVVAGLTPDQLRTRLLALAAQYVSEPNVSVVVRQINSRKVFITGQVARPGAYPLLTPATVLQLIALAGGLTEFADAKGITIIRPGEAKPLRFNYDEVRKGKKLEQNIQLKIGDTVVIP
jgi:polysaccharide biosynthesis/export protein